MFRFLLFLLVSIPMFMAAQPASTGNWWIYFGNQKISPRWNWHNEIQYRNYNVAGDLEQLLLRTGIGYNLTGNNNNVLLGYGFIDTRPYISGSDAKLKITEHRLFQQFITRQTFGRFYLQHRYRIEERFIKDDFSMRFRYFLALNVPVNQREMTQGAIYLSAYNELFIRDSSPAFDRNRLYGAVGYVVSPHIRLEAGWMRQMLDGRYRDQFQIVVFNNLPLFNENQE